MQNIFPASPVRPGRSGSPLAKIDQHRDEILEELDVWQRGTRLEADPKTRIGKHEANHDPAGFDWAAYPRDLVGYADSGRKRAGREGRGSPCNSRSTTKKDQNIRRLTATAERRLELAEAPGGQVPAGQRDLAFETMYEFGSRVGVWRLLPFSGARVCLSQYLAARWRWNAILGSPKRSQAPGLRRLLSRMAMGRTLPPKRGRRAQPYCMAIESIARTTGERPAVVLRYGPSENTQTICWWRRAGFSHDSDALQRRTSLLGGNSRPAAPGRSLYDGRKRRKICARLPGFGLVF